MQAVTASTTPTAVGASSTSMQLPANKAQEEKNQFLKLLVAQLKGQNPLDPKDGTEFISQLAQLSSLEELINIRTALENLKTSTTSSTKTNPFEGVKE